MNRLTYTGNSLIGDAIRLFKVALEKRSVFIAQTIIITATLLICLIVCPKAATGSTTALLIVAGVAGIFGVYFLVKYPHIAFVILPGASLVVPLQIGTGSESSLNFSMLVVGAMGGFTLIDFLIKRRQKYYYYARQNIPVFSLIFASVLALGSGQLFYFAAHPAPIRAQIGGMALFILSGLAYIEVAYHIRTITWLKWMTYLFLLISGAVIITNLFPVLSPILIPGGNGSLFWTWLLALGFAQALINKRLGLLFRILMWSLVAATLYLTMFKTRDWISGWLPGLIAIFVIAWLYEKRIRIPVILIAIVILLINSGLITSLFMGGDNQYSLMTRLQAWSIIGEIIKVNPVLGLGPANYYWYTPLFQILGYSVRFNSHNNYVDIVAQTGFLGLFCFVWIAWETGRLGLRLRNIVPDGFARAYVYAAIGGLVATWASGMLGDWIIPFVYNIGFNGFRSGVIAWVFLGGLVSLDHMMKTSQLTMELRTPI